MKKPNNSELSTFGTFPLEMGLLNMTFDRPFPLVFLLFPSNPIPAAAILHTISSSHPRNVQLDIYFTIHAQYQIAKIYTILSHRYHWPFAMIMAI